MWPFPPERSCRLLERSCPPHRHAVLELSPRWPTPRQQLRPWSLERALLLHRPAARAGPPQGWPRARAGGGAHGLLSRRERQRLSRCLLSRTHFWFIPPECGCRLGRCGVSLSLLLSSESLASTLHHCPWSCGSSPRKADVSLLMKNC